jgi:hypothetical protein
MSPKFKLYFIFIHVGEVRCIRRESGAEAENHQLSGEILLYRQTIHKTLSQTPQKILFYIFFLQVVTSQQTFK